MVGVITPWKSMQSTHRGLLPLLFLESWTVGLPRGRCSGLAEPGRSPGTMPHPACWSSTSPRREQELLRGCATAGTGAQWARASGARYPAKPSTAPPAPRLYLRCTSASVRSMKILGGAPGFVGEVPESDSLPSVYQAPCVGGGVADDEPHSALPSCGPAIAWRCTDRIGSGHRNQGCCTLNPIPYSPHARRIAGEKGGLVF